MKSSLNIKYEFRINYVFMLISNVHLLSLPGLIGPGRLFPSVNVDTEMADKDTV